MGCNLKTKNKYKGFHVCEMTQFQWTDDDQIEHVWAGPRTIDFISDGSSCDVLGPFPVNDDGDDGVSDDGGVGDDDETDYCHQAVGIPSDCEQQCDSKTEYFNTCADSPYHDKDEYCHGNITDFSSIDLTKYDDLVATLSVCYKRCDCLSGYKRKITDVNTGATKCVREYFCSGASEDLVGDLEAEEGQDGTVVDVTRSGDDDDLPDLNKLEARSTRGICKDDARSTCFSPYQACNEAWAAGDCLGKAVGSGNNDRSYQQKEKQLCFDRVQSHLRPRDNCKGTILGDEGDRNQARIEFIPGKFQGKHVSVRFDLSSEERDNDWFKNGRYSNTNFGQNIGDWGDSGDGRRSYWNDEDAGDAVFHILADDDVSDCYIKHVAGVAAQILDTDQNGVPDYPELARKLKENFAHIVIMSSKVYGRLGEENNHHDNFGKFGKVIEDYFTPDKFEEVMGIEGPFGYLRVPSKELLQKDGACESDFKLRTRNYKKDSTETHRLCIQDIFPGHWNDPTIDLTHREVMKSIIGFGLQYVQAVDNIF